MKLYVQEAAGRPGKGCGALFCEAEPRGSQGPSSSLSAAVPKRAASRCWSRKQPGGTCTR